MSEVTAAFLRVSFALLSAVAIVWVSLRRFEQRSLYFPEKEIIASPVDFGLAFEDVFIETEDGKRIHGWFVPASAPAIFTVLFCHGNAGNVGNRLEKTRLLSRLGMNVFLFDYRGYGRSQGTPSEPGTYRDGEAAYRYLTETRRTPAGAVIFYGESLGTAIAAELCRRFKGAGLILESPFTSVVDMAKRLLPWLPAAMVVKNRYDTLSKIHGINVPLLILHSRQDEVIPFGMGETIFAAAPHPKDFFELRGSHNDGYAITPGYAETIDKFVTRRLSSKPTTP